MIESRRLLITPLGMQDCEEARLIHNEPETLRWLSDTHPVSTEEQQVWFASLQKSNTSRRYVAREVSGKKMIGVFRFDRLDTQNHSVEVGLDITTDSRRQGFAREIYEKMIPYFFDELLLNRLSLLTLKRNLPAISLYESLGFKREGILRQAIKRDLEFEDAYQYSLLASEFGN